MIKDLTSKDMFQGFLRSEQDLVNNYDVHKPSEFVEDAACQDVDIVRLLRLICLQSQIGAGLKPKVLDGYRRLVLHSYGHAHLLSLLNLDKSGLLTKQQQGS